MSFVCFRFVSFRLYTQFGIWNILYFSSCTNKSCKCKVILDGENILKIENEHSVKCCPKSDRNLERDKCRVAVKRKAEESANCRPMKMIRRELQSNEYTEICVSDLDLVR